MSVRAENGFVPEVGYDHKEIETTFLGLSLSSDSSVITTYGRGGNNVSFVNINYTIQPKPFLAHFKEIPAKKILDNVR